MEASPRVEAAPSGSSEPIWIEPDLGFIESLNKHGGESYKKCMQCGTCSATCEISPDSNPFPAKEMAWAAWGMKDQLLKDPDVWLCYNCHDCSTRCPRGARPGDVMGAIRQEIVTHYAFPGFMGKMVNRPLFIPILLGIPALLLGAALMFKPSIQSALGVSAFEGDKIVYSYSSVFPHWLLNGFFGVFAVLALLAAVTGVVRFWRALKRGYAAEKFVPVKGVMPSIGSALRRIFMHDNFRECSTSRLRYPSHILMFFGFISLTLVTLWVITAGGNPLNRSEFAYPFNFWSPWKMLANFGGVAILVGCFLMIRERLMFRENIGRGAYFDWVLVWTLLLVLISGFATELLHYLRMEPHRHAIYFVHLVFVFGLLMYLPYSKLAHMFYRATALVFTEHIGRVGKPQQKRGESK